MKVQFRNVKEKHSGCIVCGKPIVYSSQSSMYKCYVCHEVFDSNAVCENGHYVCDKCHSSALKDFLFLIGSSEKNPIKLFEEIAAHENVHMHGPEHHSIVPCVMLTAYYNNGGEINLNVALETAIKRSKQVPGGTCGFWGACGGAIGAGIYASIVTGSNPLNEKAWGIPQSLTSRCLDVISKIGGPRCCKRSSRIAIETSVEFTKENFGIEIPIEYSSCTFYGKNNECIHERCPYYGNTNNEKL